jgi:ABC-type sugar transport system ATPase subunit
VFLFDEPLSNLDAALRAQVRVDIRALHDRLGATSVYVTHDQVEAMTLADALFVLNKGVVEQAGAPLEVYARPRTRFVAGFLGSPAINFVEGTLERGAGGAVIARGPAGLLVPLDAAAVGEADVGRRVTLGVRPHDVEPAVAGDDAAGTLQVILVEALGTESFVRGTLGGAPFVVRVDAARAVAKGDALPIVARRGHAFDPATGVALGGD